MFISQFDEYLLCLSKTRGKVKYISWNNQENNMKDAGLTSFLDQKVAHVENYAYLCSR